MLKTFDVVFKNKYAPTKPPSEMETIKYKMNFTDNCMSFLKAIALVIFPGHNATVLIPFAFKGAMLQNINDGYDMKPPPPATAFKELPSMAAKKRIIKVIKSI